MVKNMKKLILILAMVFLSGVQSCYDASQNATVRINLGNLPLAQTARRPLLDSIMRIFVRDALASNASEYVNAVHVAAFSGVSVLATTSISADDVQDNQTGSYVVLSFPAGEEITILVLGEGEGWTHNEELIPMATYYGTITQSFTAGETASVTVSMNLLDYNFLSYTLDPNFNCGGPYIYKITWNAAGFHVNYVFEDDSGNIIYSSYAIEPFAPPAGASDCYMYLSFGPFDLRTIDYSFGIGCK